nr:hypothetical protein [Pedobacter kyonggii]
MNNLSEKKILNRPEVINKRAIQETMLIMPISGLSRIKKEKMRITRPGIRKIIQCRPEYAAVPNDLPISIKPLNSNQIPIKTGKRIMVSIGK